jgi:voltage-gated potassium channel
MMKNHIILCGWNENVPFLIQNLLHKNIINKTPIVLLAEIDDKMPLEIHNIDTDLVSFVRGKATKKEDLDRANIQQAKIAILVADAHSTEPDAKSILNILTIEKYCRELEKEGKRNNRKNIYTIAEIQDTENFDSAYDAEVDEIISLGHIKSKIFVHSVLNPGVSNFINEILTYNEFNDIYSIHIKKDSILTGRTFDELLVKLRKHKILLVSISIGNHSSRKELEALKDQHQLKRTVLTNPIAEEEINYKTRPDDVLIVLTDYEKRVEEARAAWS